MVTSCLIVPAFEHLGDVSKTECPRYYRKIRGISKQIRNLNRYRAKRSALCINITAGRNSERKSTRFLFHWSQEILPSMETKIVKHSNVLLYGFSFHLILTLGSLGFTCYSLNRLDSRLTAIEQNLMLKSTPYQHANGATIKITSENAPGSGWKTTDQIVKRDISSPSICSKCRTVCSNSNTQQNVSYCSVLLLVTTFSFIFSL